MVKIRELRHIIIYLASLVLLYAFATTNPMDFSEEIIVFVWVLFWIFFVVGIVNIVYTVFILRRPLFKGGVTDVEKSGLEDEEGETSKTEEFKKAPALTKEEERRVISEISHGRCEHCGKKGLLHVHRIIPRHKGGDNKHDNLIALCPTHHKMAREKTITVTQLKNIVKKRKKK